VSSAPNKSVCLLCETRLVKNGKHPSGTQRWRCPKCGSSTIKKRADLTKRHQLDLFLSWLLSKDSQAEATNTKSGRTLRRDTAWCWNIQPSIPPVTAHYDEILVDGIYVGSWCLLIAVSNTLEVLGWQWCARESTAAWSALFERIPRPAIVVCDGGSGIAAAIKTVWPGTITQRCVFHIMMNVRQHLTLNPRTPAGIRLSQLARKLSQVQTEDDAMAWMLKLEAWWQGHGHLTKLKTFDGNKWWFTHDRLRKAWHVLHTVTKNRTLFTYVSFGNNRTTSPLEGGINNGIRAVLRNHRGMSEEHMKRAAEWFLTLKAHEKQNIYDLIKTADPAPNKTKKQVIEEPIGPATYGTGLEASEGLWLRSGWAGRS